MAEILPFRDSFNSLFFISIGMLLDLRILLAHPVLVMGLVVALVAGKMVTTAGAAVATCHSGGGGGAPRTPPPPARGVFFLLPPSRENGGGPPPGEVHGVFF